MVSFQPLIIATDTIERVKDRRTEIIKLNLGEPFIQIISGDFEFQRTVMFVHSANGITNVYNIWGGEIGDLLILGGNNVHLKNGGNLELRSNFLLTLRRSVILYKIATTWFQING